MQVLKLLIRKWCEEKAGLTLGIGLGMVGNVPEWHHFFRLGHMGHVREYTTLEVTELLERLGFRTDSLVFRGGHGRGLVGLAERLCPSMRPFFSVIAEKSDAS